MSRVRKWLAALVVVGIVAVGAYRRAISVVDAAYLEDLFNSTLTPASDGLYEVEIEDLTLSPVSRSVTIHDLRLVVRHAAADSLRAAGRFPAVRVEGRLDRVVLSGVALMRLARQRELEAEEFRVDSPVLFLEVSPQPRRPPTPAIQEAPPSQAPTGEISIPDDVPRVEIDRVRLTDIDVTIAVAEGVLDGDDTNTRPLTNELEGLSVTLHELEVDPNRTGRVDLTSLAEAAVVTLDAMRLDLPGAVGVEVTGVRASTATESVDVDAVALVPDHTMEDYLAGAGPRGPWIELSAGPIHLEALQYPRLLTELAVHARAVRIEDVELRVLVDKVRPGSPGDAASLFTPHGFVQALPNDVAVDTVRIEGGSATYLERGHQSARPGEVTFDDIDITLSNLANAPARMSAATPAVIEARMKGFGAASTTTRMEIPLLAPPPTMTVSGWIGPFEIEAVNSMLTPLEGVRVTGGAVDTAWVDVQWLPERATGSVVAIYQGLEVQMEDAETGGRNLVDHLLTAAADLAVLREDNQPEAGEAPRAGAIDYEIPAGKPYFAGLWQAIRGGIQDLMLTVELL